MDDIHPITLIESLSLVTCLVLKTIHQLLQDYWGYQHFRLKQEVIINHIISGGSALAILPTGGGKSICYQIPGLYLGGICLVISPLISLMTDQVQALKAKGISAVAIYSGLAPEELEQLYEDIEEGMYSFVYVSPERLKSELFLAYLPHWNIKLLAIDEAHCISQWGYDFRPSYLVIANIKPYLNNVPIIALTASATPRVQEDIIEKLALKNSVTFFTSFARENLSMSVFETPLKLNKLVDILGKVKGSALVYCRNRKQTKDLSDTLLAQGFKASEFHAGLTSAQKEIKQQQWLDDTLTIMVCTNAFGMGIDKPDVRLVVHYDIPESPEAFYQEAGRAGRDGKRAYHVLFYQNRDLDQLIQRSAWKYPPIEQIKKIYESLCQYFSIPLGAGEDEAYYFTLADFCIKFDYPLLETLGAIQCLEQNGYLLMTDSFHKPSRVQVLASKEDINNLSRTYPKMDEVLQQLLRSYQGILAFPVVINEFNLAKKMEVSHDYVKHILKGLHQHELIRYVEQDARPQLIFLQPRLNTAFLYIDKLLLEKLKSEHNKRIEYMISIARNRSRCRMRFLIAYFEEQLETDCGICDLCLENKKKSFSEKFDDCKSTILQHLEVEGFIHIEDFCSPLNPHQREAMIQTIRLLMDEGILTMDSKGDIIKQL